MAFLSGHRVGEFWQRSSGDLCPRLNSPARCRTRSTYLSTKQDPPLHFMIERTFGETRRRAKVIGRLPGERTCVGVVWAVLDRASRGWRGVVMTPAAVPQLQELRRQPFGPPTIEEVTTSTDTTVTTAA